MSDSTPPPMKESLRSTRELLEQIENLSIYNYVEPEYYAAAVKGLARLALEALASPPVQGEGTEGWNIPALAKRLIPDAVIFADRDAHVLDLRAKAVVILQELLASVPSTREGIIEECAKALEREAAAYWKMGDHETDAECHETAAKVVRALKGFTPMTLDEALKQIRQRHYIEDVTGEALSIVCNAADRSIYLKKREKEAAALIVSLREALKPLTALPDDIIAYLDDMEDAEARKLADAIRRARNIVSKG